MEIYTITSDNWDTAIAYVNAHYRHFQPNSLEWKAKIAEVAMELAEMDRKKRAILAAIGNKRAMPLGVKL